MARLLADITPLRESKDFRLLFGGQLVSFVGSQLTAVAVPFQVFEITHSSLAVGLVSLVQLVPLLVGSLLGGAVADSMDRRRLLILMLALMALADVPLAINGHLGARAHLWPVVVFSAVAAAMSGIERPTRSAAIPALVDKTNLPAAYALWQVLIQIGTVTGPALAGILLSRYGLATVYWIDVVTFFVAIVAMVGIRPLPPEGGGTKAGLASIVEGIRFVKGRPALQGSFLIDINAMVFGLPRALFPEIGTRVLGGGASTVGLLYAAPGAGALIGAVLTGWVSRVRHQGRAVVIAVAVWGLAVTGFGFVRVLPIALVFLAIAGAADMVSAVFRNTILQTAVPDSLRGRLSAMHIAVVTGGPRVGDLEAGSVRALTTPRVSVVSGGLACVVGALIVAWRLPAFARYVAEPADVADAEAGAAAHPDSVIVPSGEGGDLEGLLFEGATEAHEDRE